MKKGNHKIIKERLEEKIFYSPDGCWYWTGAIGGNGRGHVAFKREGGGQKIMLSHRLSFELYKGPIPKGKFICHHCDNPLCLNPDHLYVGTALENNHDAIKRGRRTYKGTANVKCKINENQVREIRRLLSIGVRNKSICERLHVTDNIVGGIKSGRTWQHI